ncbi:hypothetical protein [Planctomicrobium sp. SH527]|uniref:hypothetical protein n=1 Tax=Planctomicrobium sp. SH527 TaxID=3448123 RepID=UPI003F5BB03D
MKLVCDAVVQVEIVVYVYCQAAEAGLTVGVTGAEPKLKEIPHPCCVDGVRNAIS